ncbi:MAG: TonB-dependent receptor, partial [Pseudomonadota bacterium]
MKTTASAVALLAVAPTWAAADAPQRIDVPAQPLAEALTELGRETGMLISAPTAMIADKTSPAVSGRMTPSEALGLMLLNTGLTMRVIGEESAVVVRRDLVTQDTTEDFELPPIIVRGELIERDIQDSQTSAVIITGDELEARAETQLNEIIGRTPGVSATGLSYSIRGIPAGGPSGTGVGATINVVVDGARVSDVGDGNPATYSTWDLEQLEVLRGPQSTQSGRNALAGTVTLRSADPIYDEEYKLRLGAGTYNTYSAAFVANAPIIEDVLAFRLSGDFDTNDGFTENITLGQNDVQGRDRKTLRASVRYDPTPDFSAVLKYTWFDDVGTLEGVNVATWPDDRFTTADYVAPREQTLSSWNLRLGYDFNANWRLESDTTFFNQTTAFGFDPDRGPIDSGFTRRENDLDTFEQEVRLRYQTDRLNAVVGAFYTHLDTTSETVAEVPGNFLVLPFPAPPGAKIIATATGDFETTNYAVFGEVEYEVIDDLRLIAGARYDFEEDKGSQTGEANLVGAGPNPIPIPLTQDTINETEFNAFLPKFGFVYDFNDDMSLGFTYQQGYRAGGSRTNLAALPSYDYEFDPEFTDNYELAYRSEWLDGDLVVNANAFYTYWRDQQ